MTLGNFWKGEEKEAKYTQLLMFVAEEKTEGNFTLNFLIYVYLATYITPKYDFLPGNSKPYVFLCFPIKDA